MECRTGEKSSELKRTEEEVGNEPEEEHEKVRKKVEPKN